MVEQRSGRTKVSNQGIYIRLFFSGHPTAFNFAYLWYRAMDTARNGSTADEDRIEEARLCPALRFSKHANFLPQGIRAYSDSVGSGPKVADIRSSDQLELAKNVPMVRERAIRFRQTPVRLREAGPRASHQGFFRLGSE